MNTPSPGCAMSPKNDKFLLTSKLSYSLELTQKVLPCVQPGKIVCVNILVLTLKVTIIKQRYLKWIFLTKVLKYLHKTGIKLVGLENNKGINDEYFMGVLQSFMLVEQINRNWNNRAYQNQQVEITACHAGFERLCCLWNA